MSDQFALCYRAFKECDDEIQAVIVDLIDALNDPAIDDDQRQAALATIADALFPEEPNFIDLDEQEATERQIPAERAIHEELDAEEATFADSVARLMAEQHLTQQQLADKVGVGQPAIAMMLARRGRPQRRTVEKIAAALGVTPRDLWSAEE